MPFGHDHCHICDSDLDLLCGVCGRWLSQLVVTIEGRGVIVGACGVCDSADCWPLVANRLHLLEAFERTLLREVGRCGSAWLN